MKTLLDKEDSVFNPPQLGCVLSLTGLPGGGSKTYDRGPYGNVGTITGATWKQSPGGLWYLDFDGSDDYVDCGNDASLDITDAITIGAWVKLPSTPGSWGRILSKGYSYYTLSFPPAGLTPVARISGLSGGSGQELFGSAIGTDVWTFLGLTYNKDGGANNFRMYIDGRLDRAVTHTGQISTGGSLCVGSTDTPNEFLGGCIALVMICNRALSDLEMHNHFNREKLLIRGY